MCFCQQQLKASDCATNAGNIMKKFSVLLASLQNYNQYDGDVDILKQQLLQILSEVDSCELHRWALEQIYNKVNYIRFILFHFAR